MTEKLANILKKVTIALLYIVFYLGLQTALFIVVEHLGGDIVNYTGVVTIVSALVSLGVYTSFSYVRGIKLTKSIKRKRLSLFDVVFSFTLAIGCRIMTSSYFILTEKSEVLHNSVEKADVFNLSTMTSLGGLSVIVAMYIIAPIFEEILFRGIVLQEFKSVMPVQIAVILQAVLFGVAHTILAQSLFTAVIGIILGAIYHRTKNIRIVMLIHFIFNFSAAIEIKNEGMVMQILMMGLIVTITSIFMFYYIYRRKQTPVANTGVGGMEYDG